MMMLILCRKCGIEKERSEFLSRQGGKHRTPCRSCILQRNREWRAANPEQERLTRNRYTKATRSSMRSRIQEIKLSAGCVDCGYKENSWALHFDHLEDKEDCVSIMVHNRYSWGRIKSEIEKCQIRCVVCHRIRTYKDTYKNRNKIRNFVEKAKDIPCKDCRRKFPPYAMDFDHREPEHKHMCVGRMATLSPSLSTLQKEIDKCDVVCANCHVIRTEKERVTANG